MQINYIYYIIDIIIKLFDHLFLTLKYFDL